MFKPKTKTTEPENAKKAYEYAVFLLSLKLRTMGEVLEKMKKRGYVEAVIEATIKQLKDNRYLDDQRYAEIFLENLKAYKNFGYYGIKKKLMEKKLSSGIIEKVLADGLPVDEEIKIAKRFLKKEGIAVKPVSEGLGQAEGLYYTTYDDGQSKKKQKIFQKLKARGFRGQVITKLMV